MIRAALILAAGIALASCSTPRGRECLGFLEKCGENLRCVSYLQRTGLEATCEIACTSDEMCPPTDRCKVEREDQYGPVNICVKREPPR